jgi:hypothetical protein
MLGPDLAVMVDVGLCLAAVQDLALAHGKQLVAVGAFVQVIVFFLQEKFQFFHEEPTDQLIFSLFQQIQAVQ